MHHTEFEHSIKERTDQKLFEFNAILLQNFDNTHEILCLFVCLFSFLKDLITQIYSIDREKNLKLFEKYAKIHRNHI